MLQFLVNGLCIGAIIAIVALGFGLIYNTTRIFHLAHGGIYVLTGYVAWSATSLWKISFAWGIPLALLAAALAGILIYWVVYQPLVRRSASTAVVMISSIGVQIVLVNILILAFGNQPQLLQTNYVRIFNIDQVIITYIQAAQLVAGIVLTFSFWLFLKYTHVGQICRAVSDDETLSRVIGVRSARVHLLVFALGSIFAGVGSILVALDVGLDPYVGFPTVLTAAVACIIGGLRSFLAPAIGGFLLGIVQSMVVWQTSAQWREAVTFGLLIIFLLVRRQGLFGVYKRAEEA